MKLLIITQIVDIDDSVLGFFHRWIIEFSKSAESVIVICLKEGKHDFPKNVRVLSLGKEKGESKLKYLYRFYKYIFTERKNYNQVFVHMNQIYVVLGGLFWRFFGKKVGLWYAHGSVSLSLWVAEKFADYIFSSTKMGFRLKSYKLFLVGQGIDTDLFRPKEDILKENIVVTVGRISTIKNIDKMIDLITNFPDYSLNIVGEALTNDDQEYLSFLKRKTDEMGLINRVIFLGKKTGQELVFVYNKAKIFINQSGTGSLDKAVLEAISCNLPTMTTNQAFNTAEFKNVFFEKINFNNVKYILDSTVDCSNCNREVVVKNHSINNLILKIINTYSNKI